MSTADDRRILKWDVPVDDRWHPVGGGPVVHVACQYGPGSVQVWTIEHNEALLSPGAARVYGTGHVIPSGTHPIGSAVTDHGLVWHVLATNAPKEDR